MLLSARGRNPFRRVPPKGRARRHRPNQRSLEATAPRASAATAPASLFDGTRGGEILILVLTLGLLVELELARAATHFYLYRDAPRMLRLEKRKLLKMRDMRVREQKSRRGSVCEAFEEAHAWYYERARLSGGKP